MAPRKPQQQPAPAPRFKWWWVLAVALTLGIGADLLTATLGPAEVPYSELKRLIESGEVSALDLGPTVAVARLGKEGPAQQRVRAVRVEDPGLYAQLEEKGVKVTGVPPPPAWQGLWPWLLMLLPFLFWSRLAGGARGLGALTPGAAHPRLYAERELQVTFADVAGCDEAKVELREVLDFLKSPERFRKVGGKLPKGVLLVGPPGTGKTLLARAVAGEAQVPFFNINGSEFVELFVGVGAARVRDLFATARKSAPCIIFIDELDALGKVRGAAGLAGNEEREQTLNQLLVELDGFDPGQGVVLMAATNRPETLDPALLRAGRFDRHVAIDRPDRDGRLAILKVHAKKLALGPDADLEALAALTAGLVGADLATLLNEAALQAVRHGRDQVGRAELDEALERARAGISRKSRVLSRDEKRRVAVHESGHALAASRLPGVDPVRKVSVLPRGIGALGFTLQQPQEDRLLLTRAQLESRIAVLLGGRVAERLVLGEVSTGAQDDLVRATLLARGMVRAFGMSEALGPVSLEQLPPVAPTGFEALATRPEESEATRREVDLEVRRVVAEQESRVQQLLHAERSTLERLAEALLERESLGAEELEPLLRAPRAAA